MDTRQITPEKVVELAAIRSWPSVSIYEPSGRLSPDARQGPIRLKNLLTEAERQLVEAGVRPTLARDLLKPASELVGGEPFWSERPDGVAIFAQPERFEVFRLPFATPSYAGVGEAFYVRPLVPALHLPRTFCALALEKGAVRLIRCGPQSTAEVRVPDMPSSFEAFVASDHAEKQLQMHSAGRAGGVIFHGAGDSGVDEKDRLHRFCIAIDHAVTRHLAANPVPLVLIGAEPIVDIYANASKYPHLHEMPVRRSPKLLDRPAEVRAAAEPLLAQDVERERRGAIATYLARAGTGLTSQSESEILIGAENGRVDVLLVDPAQSAWGAIGPHGIDIHAGRLAGDVELVDRAVSATLMNSGVVFEASSEEIRSTGPMAAVMRY